MELLHNNVLILTGNYVFLERPYYRAAPRLCFIEIHEGISQISYILPVLSSEKFTSVHYETTFTEQIFYLFL